MNPEILGLMGDRSFTNFSRVSDDSTTLMVLEPQPNGHRMMGTPRRDILDSTNGQMDQVLGRGGRDRLIAGKRDQLYGGKGNDNLNARDGKGRNYLFGQKGHDRLFAKRKDQLFGNQGNDVLSGRHGKGHNILKGGQGNDELMAGKGDRLFGGVGEDVLDASASGGGNTLRAGAGNDWLYAGVNDGLYGGDGDDILWAGTGGSTLTGGSGRDQFWIVEGGVLPDEINIITDFEVGVDQVAIAGLDTVTDITDLSLTQDGTNTVISIQGEAIAILNDVTPNSLKNEHFIFAAPVGNPEPEPDGTVTTTVTLVSRAAKFDNEMGYFFVDDLQGRIDGLLPDDEGYTAKALERAQVLFTATQAPDETATIDIPDQHYVGWYIIQNGTTQQLRNRNPDNELTEKPLVFFSFADANPDGDDHLMYRSSTELGWEDLTNGGDRSFDDLVFKVEQTVDSPQLPFLPTQGTISGFKWNDLNGDGLWQRTSTPGKVVVNHDEWVFSNTGFTESPDAEIFIRNLASYFTGGEIGVFHAYSNNFGLDQTSLAAALESAGHTWTVGTDIDFNLETLLEFDGVFLAGDVAADTNILIDYVNAGGNVYLGGGTGLSSNFTVASTEANFWNPFLNAFGLEFASSHSPSGRYGYNLIQGNLPISSSHPIFKGVTRLYQLFGNSITDLQPENPNNQIIQTTDGQGLYAVYSTPVEPGVTGVTIYIDSNNNGILDPGEPVEITAEDDLDTPDIDETGKYEFTNLLPGTYTIREIIPLDTEQTFPLQTRTIVASISDGEFEDSDWTTTSRIVSEGSNLEFVENSQQQLTDGNPEAYRRMTHQWGSGTQVVINHKYENFIYDPSVQGEFEFINYSDDRILFEPDVLGDVVGRGMAIFQGGDVFRRETPGFGNTEWQTLTLNGLRETDFISLTTGKNPDFSESGTPIQFGYQSSNTIFGSTRSSAHGIDNWSVTLVDVDTNSHQVDLGVGEVVEDNNFGNR